MYYDFHTIKTSWLQFNDSAFKTKFEPRNVHIGVEENEEVWLLIIQEGLCVPPHYEITFNCNTGVCRHIDTEQVNL